MRKTLWPGALLLCCIVLAVGNAIARQAITATTPAEFSGPVGSVHTNCQISPAGGSALCLAGDGAWLSVNGGAWVQIGGAQGTSVTSITINGTTKPGPTPSFTIAAAATTPAISAN